MRKAALALVLSCLGSLVFPQKPFPRLVTEVGEKSEALPVAAVDLEARIIGCVAETRMTLTFRNPYDEVLEGELTFPLPEGATISGYALDIDGVMVDGVVVEQNEGRRVFEKIVREGSDPGLAEWVTGNAFRTRLYPIPASGQRRVMVRYVSEIETRPDGQFYSVPLSFPGLLENFSLRIESIRTRKAPTIKTMPAPGLTFTPTTDGYRAERTWRNIEVAQEIIIEMPEVDQTAVYVESSQDGHRYFLIPYLHPPQPKRIASFAPKRVRLLWDASGSLAAADHTRKLRVLRAFLDQVLRSRPALELVVFRNRAESVRPFSGTLQGVEALISELRSVAYDGATQIAGLRQSFGPDVPDLYLLFTDGLANFGRGPVDSFDAPVYAISDSLTTNYALLRQLADSTGGDYFNLSTADEQEVVRSIGNSRRSRLRVSEMRGEIQEPLSTAPAPGRPMSVIGTILTSTAEVILTAELAGRAVAEARFRIEASSAVPGELLRTYWAQQKIQDLMADPVASRDQLIEIGKEFDLVTPGTSLIVLERLDQYLEFGIAPPGSLPEMRAEWEARMRHRKEEAENEIESKLEHITDLWQRRVEWWETDFQAEPRPVPRAKAHQAASRPAAPVSQTPELPPAPRQSAAVNPPPEQLNQTQTAPPPVVHQTASSPCRPRQMRENPRTIVGTVKDQTGGVIPEARIAITNKTTGTTDVFVTDECGVYRSLPLPAGCYSVQAEMTGFQTATIDGVDVQRASVPVDLELRVGEISEQIMVSAESVSYLSLATSVSASVVSVTQSRLSYTGTDLGTIEVEEWNPETPYLKALKAARAQIVPSYLEQRKIYGTAPAFYLDCADFFSRNGETELALQVLSNIAEICLDDPAFLRILGHRLAQLGFLELSATVFERVLQLRPEEPQSFRDLALVLADLGRYDRAIELLSKVVMQEWDRFEEIEVIALNEINRMISTANRPDVGKTRLDPRLIQPLDADIRIVLTWDADETDMDLWVTEPTGEQASYQNRLTDIGGAVSKDFTEGYGPEEYVLRKAVPGKYRIEVDYYGSHVQKLQGPVTVQADIYTNYGRANEERKRVTVRLIGEKDAYHIADVDF